MSRLTVTTLLVAVLSYFGAGAAQAQLCQPLTYDGTRIAIPVVIDGEEYPAVITTGSITSTITGTLARSLGKTILTDPTKILAPGVGKGRRLEYIKDVDLSFDGATIPAKRLIVVEGDDSAITLSLRLFDGYITQVDFSQLQLCFYSREAIDLRKYKNVKIDSDPYNSNPLVRVSLNGNVDTWLELSLGFSGGIIIAPSIASLLDLYDREDIREADSDGLFEVKIQDLEFGPYNLENVSALFPKPGVSHNLVSRAPLDVSARVRRGQSSYGHLGLEVLKHFTVTLDLEKERMHLIAN